VQCRAACAAACACARASPACGRTCKSWSDARHHVQAPPDVPCDLFNMNFFLDFGAMDAAEAAQGTQAPPAGPRSASATSATYQDQPMNDFTARRR
jgi:hypothetical protein